MTYKLFILITTLTLTFIGCGGGGSSSLETKGTLNNTTNKSHIAIYMTGSDLEEKFNAASSDLHEIVSGYERLSKDEKNNLKLIVAFGGSRVTNWKGIKYADISCLSKDAKDNIFGNDSCYTYVDENANMGSSNTLSSFLNFVSGDREKNEQKYLFFWNHGSAFQGICYDSNKLGDKLTIGELSNALETQKTVFTLIGMDACLMANIEVIKGIKSYADYFLASEENEPTHGWNYEDVIYYIGNKEYNKIEDIGKKLVDSYLDSEEHQSSKDKTLSLLKLSQADSLFNSIDILSQNLDGTTDFKAIGLSAYESEKYGLSSYQDGLTMDIKSFANRLKFHTQNRDLSTKAENLSNIISDLVVYNRQQNQFANSFGISIYQLYYPKLSRQFFLIPYSLTNLLLYPTFSSIFL